MVVVESVESRIEEKCRRAKEVIDKMRKDDYVERVYRGKDYYDMYPNTGRKVIKRNMMEY